MTNVLHMYAPTACEVCGSTNTYLGGLVCRMTVVRCRDCRSHIVGVNTAGYPVDIGIRDKPVDGATNNVDNGRPNRRNKK